MSPITPATLLPVCQQLWQQTSQSLPPADAARWQVNRVVQPHGTRRTVLLWRVWDQRVRQLGLDPWYCCWCLQYDPENFYNRRSNWQLHLYANTVRIYRENQRARGLLERRLKEVCPPGFDFLAPARTVELSWCFHHLGTLAELPARIAPMLRAGLTATAPVFDELFSLVGRAPTSAERQDTQTNRPRPYAPTADPDARPHNGALRRDIPPGLRQQVLARSANRCAICRQPFVEGDEIHLDHIIPWAEGGLTVLENLQPTHARCNLRKGGHPNR